MQLSDYERIWDDAILRTSRRAALAAVVNAALEEAAKAVTERKVYVTSSSGDIPADEIGEYYAQAIRALKLTSSPVEKV